MDRETVYSIQDHGRRKVNKDEDQSPDKVRQEQQVADGKYLSLFQLLLWTKPVSVNCLLDCHLQALILKA